MSFVVCSIIIVVISKSQGPAVVVNRETSRRPFAGYSSYVRTRIRRGSKFYLEPCISFGIRIIRIYHAEYINIIIILIVHMPVREILRIYLYFLVRTRYTTLYRNMNTICVYLNHYGVKQFLMFWYTAVVPGIRYQVLRVHIQSTSSGVCRVHQLVMCDVYAMVMGSLTADDQIRHSPENDAFWSSPYRNFWLGYCYIPGT